MLIHNQPIKNIFFFFLSDSVAIDLIVQAISDYLKSNKSLIWKGKHFGIQQIKNLHESLAVANNEQSAAARAVSPGPISKH